MSQEDHCSWEEPLQQPIYILWPSPPFRPSSACRQIWCEWKGVNGEDWLRGCHYITNTVLQSLHKNLRASRLRLRKTWLSLSWDVCMVDVHRLETACTALQMSPHWSPKKHLRLNSWMERCCHTPQPNSQYLGEWSVCLCGRANDISHSKGSSNGKPCAQTHQKDIDYRRKGRGKEQFFLRHPC